MRPFGAIALASTIGALPTSLSCAGRWTSESTPHAVEPQLGEMLRLSASRPETGAPEETLGLLGTERSRANGQ